MQVRDRIKDFRRVPASDLKPNPKNWRTHPEGQRNVLTADMVKPGAVVIDVGMNRNDAGKLCGDVDYEGVREVAGWITPVPGGVGPMTRAMLLVNTIEAAERSA